MFLKKDKKLKKILYNYGFQVSNQRVKEIARELAVNLQSSIYFDESSSLKQADFSGVTDAGMIYSGVSKFSGVLGKFRAEYNVDIKIVNLSSSDSNLAEREAMERFFKLPEAKEINYFFGDNKTQIEKIQNEFPNLNIKHTKEGEKDKKVKLLDGIQKWHRKFKDR